MLLVLLLFVSGGYWYVSRKAATSVISPIGQIFEKPLEKYTIDRLSSRIAVGSQITLDEAVATTSAYTAYKFHFTSEGPTSSGEAGLRGAGKKVTGLAHIPNSASETNKKPVIVQFRGYVEHDIFESGMGTRRSAEVFARNGFISLAPDFLGYGGSDNPSEDVFEERFQTYIAGLDLLASIPSLPMTDSSRVGIWGHSNGGQIALTILEITGKPYPTTLWAPVSKPFPYSILYYTDEAEDRGKALRKKLADFERDYDVELYSLPNFVDRIAAPVQLHQGTGDAAVPVKWNDEFVSVLQDKKKDIEYFVYPGADHNLTPSWNTVIGRDVAFFRKFL